MNSRMIKYMLGAVSAFALVAPAVAAETMTYHYDALGRLIESYSDKTAFRTDYTFDAADNRTQVYVHNTNIILRADQSIYSPDGRFQLVMQTDGNLVLYGPSGALWSSTTAGSGATFAQTQTDGNFVVYTAANVPVWSSGTSGNPGAWLALQNDGNLVIYDGSNVAIWNSHTGGH